MSWNTRRNTENNVFLEKIQTRVETIDLILTNFQLISVNLEAELFVAAGPLIYIFFVV